MISTIIPAYNNASYIRDAIASVLAQDVLCEEIIVVDDGSTDDTRTVVAVFSERVRYVYQSNAGPAAARNRGVCESHGEWIAFLDADDRWPQNKLVRQLRALQAYPELVLVAGDMAETDAAGVIIEPSVLAKHHLLRFFHELDGGPIPQAMARLVTKNFIPTGSVLIRRSALDAVGLFDPSIRFGEDLELWARVAERFAIACLPEVMLLRRQHGANATRATEQMAADLVKVARAIRGWGADELSKQGTDADEMVATALNDFGYLLFSMGRYGEAHQVFAESLRERPSAFARKYSVLTNFPPFLLRPLRSLRRAVARIGESS